MVYDVRDGFRYAQPQRALQTLGYPKMVIEDVSNFIGDLGIEPRQSHKLNVSGSEVVWFGMSPVQQFEVFIETDFAKELLGLSF